MMVDSAPSYQRSSKLKGWTECWRLLSLAFLLVVASGCSSGETEVFPLPQLTSVDEGVTQGIRFSVKREHFVVANPPGDPDEIRRFVNAYLDSREQPAADASSTAVFRYFYRETPFTPRDYSELNRGYFHHDRIDDHARDILVVVVSYPPDKKREFNFLRPEDIP